MSHVCLYYRAAQHRLALADNSLPSGAVSRRLSWPSWLGYIPRWYACTPKTVTKRAQRRYHNVVPPLSWHVYVTLLAVVSDVGA